MTVEDIVELDSAVETELSIMTHLEILVERQILVVGSKLRNWLMREVRCPVVRLRDQTRWSAGR